VDNFEVFRFRSRRFDPQPRVSLLSRGDFGLNSAAFEALGRPKTVELAFDRAHGSVSLRATNPRKANAYTVRRQKKAESYIVAGKAFCVYFGIALPAKATRFIAEPSTEGLVLHVRPVTSSTIETKPHTGAKPEGTSACELI
jgi:hypothetical protein